jgi:hypothetical protein
VSWLRGGHRKPDLNEAALAADACAWVEPTVVALI